MTSKVRLLPRLVLTAGSLVLTATAAFARCKFPDLPYEPMSAVIAQGGWLSVDGRGAYVDGTQGSTVNRARRQGAVPLQLPRHVLAEAEEGQVAGLRSWAGKRNFAPAINCR